MISPLHQAARDFAASGVPVFPCVVDGKLPATARGFHDATIDLAQIDRWWSENPLYNVALSPDDAGWAVIDIDPGGETTWENLLLAEGEAPATYTVQTPRGGRHLYFAGKVPGTVAKLGYRLDTRGEKSYVLIPPSVVEGKPYKVVDDRAAAPLPGWIAPRLAASNQRIKAARVDLDTRANIERARTLLHSSIGRGSVAIQGCGGNQRTYELACELQNLGISVEVCHRLLLDIWNPHCLPPWDEAELFTIATNAGNYAQNEAGAWAVPSGLEAFGNSPTVRAALAEIPERSRFYPEDELEQENGPDPTWLIENLLPEIGTALVVGPTQSYKSFLLLDIALAIAYGLPAFGTVPLSGLVFYAAAEGRSNIKKQRRRAWKIARDVTTTSGNFYVMPAPVIAIPGQADEFIEQLEKRAKRRLVRLVVLDTTNKIMAGMNENDAGDVGRFTMFCGDLAERLNCLVVAIHHTGKDASRGARGSSAFDAGFDTVIQVRADRDSKAVEVWVQKHKDAEEPAKPWTLIGSSIGGSLVFKPTTIVEHKAAMADLDECSPKNVGRVIYNKKWDSRSNSGSSAELLVAMRGIGALGDETAVRRLDRLGAGPLKNYCARENGSVWWFIPKREDEA